MLSLWTMSLSRLRWPNEYKDPYAEQGKLVMYLGAMCDYLGVDDGVSMGFTCTLVGIPTGLYNVQARVDYVLYIFWKCNVGGGEISLFINGNSVSLAKLKFDGECSKSDWTGMDLSMSNVQIKGDGSDKFMLYVDIKDCTVLTTYWDNIALALVSRTGSNASAATPIPSQSLHPSAMVVPIPAPTQDFTPAPVHGRTRNPAQFPLLSCTGSATLAPSVLQPPQLSISPLNMDAPLTTPSDAPNNHNMQRVELAVHQLSLPLLLLTSPPRLHLLLALNHN